MVRSPPLKSHTFQVKCRYMKTGYIFLYFPTDVSQKTHELFTGTMQDNRFQIDTGFILVFHAYFVIFSAAM